MGRILRVLRGISDVLLACDHGHGLRDGQSTHCNTHDVDRRISQNDQDEASNPRDEFVVSKATHMHFRVRRFGETLPLVENILRVTPFEVAQRHRRTISDYALYKKMHSTLPAAVLASQRQRVREGEPKAIHELWQSHDKTFLAIDFEWSERNTSSCLEWGYAAVRCSHLEA